MNQCEFYKECGKAVAYFCEHQGKKKDGADAACMSYNVLERAVRNADEKINGLEQSSRVTPKIMRLNFIR